MALDPRDFALLQARESCRLTPYQDSSPARVWTDGWGNTIDVVPNGPPITQEKADADFARNLAMFEAAVDESVKVPLLSNQRGALVSFAYNVGANGEEHSHVVSFINAGDFDAAAKAFDMWHIPPEITTRRNGEKFQFIGTTFAARCDNEGKPLP